MFVFMVFIKAHVLHASNFSVHLRSVLVCISMCVVFMCDICSPCLTLCNMYDLAIVSFVFQTEMGGWDRRLAVGIYILMLAVTVSRANEGGNINS